MPSQNVSRLPEIELRADVRANAIFHVFLYTGCRVGDLVALELHDVMLGERSGSVVFRCGKGNQQRSVPIPFPARRAMQAYLDTRPPLSTTAVFVGGGMAYKQLSRPHIVWRWDCSRPYLAPTTNRGELCFEPTNATHHKSALWNQYVKHSRGLFSPIHFRPTTTQLFDPTRGPWNARWRLEVRPSQIDRWRGAREHLVWEESGFLSVLPDDIATLDGQRRIASQVEAIDAIVGKHCPPPFWSRATPTRSKA